MFLFVFTFAAFCSLSQASLTYNTAGTYTWTCPPNITSITVECWGAGGAGGGATGNPSAGGGGAGGGYVRNNTLAVVPGTTYTITVGAGGTGSYLSGTSGGSSWFGSTSTLLAVGGNGGAVASVGNQAANGGSGPITGNIGFSPPLSYYGGNGSNSGTSGRGGSGGGSAGSASNGNAATATAGGVAVLNGGAGANGSINSQDGLSGGSPGGGGAGGRTSNTTDRNGGSGADGLVKITVANMSVYPSSGTFTVPANVNTVTVQAWGGGGNGGSVSISGAEAGGGGGGAFSTSNVPVVSGTQYAVTVGTGGGSGGGANNGGNSTFQLQGNSTILVQAAGGSGVPSNTFPGGAGGTVANSIGTTRYAGGNGAASATTGTQYAGGGGSSAGSATTGTSAINPNGATAPNNGGNGGNGQVLVGDGSPGFAPGGGGGGSRTNSSAVYNGGSGANGQVIITWVTCFMTVTYPAGGSYCISNASTQTPVIAGFSGGTWSATPAGLSINASTGAIVPSTSTPGTYTINNTNNTCGTKPTIVINALPTAASAGASQLVCGVVSTALSGNTPTVGTGAWSKTSGTSTVAFSNINSGNATATLQPPYTYGNYTYTWTISNGPCAISSANVTVTYNNPALTANAGGALAAICQGGVSAALGGSVSAGTGAWSDGGIGGSFSNTNISTATYTPPIAFSGTVTLTLTATNNPCTAQASKTLLVNPGPITVDPGVDAHICSDGGASYVGATATFTGAGNTFTWSSSNGTGILVDQFTLNNVLYTATAADVAAGTRNLRLTVSNGACSKFADKSIIFDPAPTVKAGTAAISICSNINTINLYETGITSATNNPNGVFWETNGSNAITNVSSLTTASYTLSAADKAGTSLSFTLTAVGTAACGDESSTKVYSITQEPGITTLGNTNPICSNSSNNSFASDAVVLRASGYLWTTSGTGTLTNATSLTSVTYTPGASESGNITFTLRAYGNGPCTFVESSKVISIVAAPFAEAGNDFSICANANNVPLNQSGAAVSNASSVLWSAAGGGTFTNAGTFGALFAPSASQIAAGFAILTLTANGNSPCNASSDTRKILVNPLPVVTIPVISDICKASTTALLNAAVSGTYTAISWTSSVAGGTFSPDASTLNATYTPPASYTGAITLTLIATGGCATASSFDSRTFDVVIPPDAGPAIAAICPGVATTSLNGTVYGGTGQWSTTANGSFSPGANSLTATWTPPPGYSGTATLILTATSGACLNSQASKTIVVKPPNTVTIGATFTEVCKNGITPNLNASFGGSATGGTWAAGVSGGSFANVNDPNTTYTLPMGYGPGNVTLRFTSTGGCGSVYTDKNFTVVTPVLTPGPALSVCTNTTGVNITGSSSITGGYTSVNWTSSGDGSFTNNGNLTNTTYLPGTNDKINGSATIYLNAVGSGACSGNGFTAGKLLTISPLPTANAGSNMPAICSNIVNPLNITTGASVANAGSLLWSGGLDGSFGNNGSITTTTYLPGVADKAAGSVLLTLTAYGSGGCSAFTATSSKLLPITQLPDPNFTYLYNEYWKCSNNAQPVANAAITLGTISAAPATLSVNSASGLIDFANASSLAGTYTLTNSVPAANGCPLVTGTFPVTLYATPTISSPANKTQNACLGTAMSDIVFDIGSKVGAVTVSSLPAGIGYIFNSATGKLTLSGTPSQTGVFNYTVMVNQSALTTGQQCNGGAAYTTTGAITVYTPPSLTLTSAAGTNNQKVCLVPYNFANIVYAVAGNVATVSVTGLPAGLSGNLSGGNFTISGIIVATPGSYIYTVTATGTSGACNNAVATGTILVSVVPPVLTGLISGVNSLCPPANGLAYSIPAGVNVGSYVWSMPEAAWTVSNGQGTNSILVNVTGAASFGTKTISVYASNGCGNTSASPINFSVAVSNFAGVNVSNDTTFCSGGVANLSATLGGSASSLTWSSTGDGVFSSNTSLSPVYTPGNADKLAGSATLTATTNTPSGTCNTVGIGQVLVTIRPLPVASLNINGSSTVCSGSTSPVYISGTPNTTVTYKINGAAAQTVDLGASGTADFSASVLTANTQYLLISIAYTSNPTCSQALSGVTTITVNQGAAVVAGPDLTLCQTTSGIILSGASVSGGTSSGTWTFSPSGSSTGTLSNTGATTNPSTVVFTNHPSFGGNVIFTLTSNDPDGAGPCPAVSATRSLRIDLPYIVTAGPDINVCMPATSVPIVLSGSSITGAVGGMAAWSLVGSPGGTLSNTSLTSTPAAVTYTPISGPSNLSLQLKLSSNTVAGNVCLATSAVRTVNVYREVIVSAGTDQTKCGNAGVSFNLAGSISGGATTGTWSTGGTGTFNNAASLSAIYTPSAADIAAGQVVLTLTSIDPAGACGAKSATVTMFINTPVTVSANSGYTVCEGGQTLFFGSGTGSPQVTWTAASGTFSNPNTLTTTYFPGATSGTINITLTAADPDGTGPCTGAVSTSTVLVKPKPVLTSASAATVCSGTTFAYTTTSNPVGTFTWSRAVVAGISNAAGSGSGASISETLVNAGNTAVNALYQLVMTANGCSNTATVTALVNPKPAIPNQAVSVCGNNSFTVTPQNAVPDAATIVPANTLYTWAVAPVVTGGLTGGSTGSNLSGINGSLGNSSASAQTATYTVTPVAGTCTGGAFAVVATVNPTPFIPNQALTICSGSSFSIAPANNPPGIIAPAGTIYTWGTALVSGSVTGSSAQATGVSQISQTLTNTGTSAGTVTYTVTPRVGTCDGAPFTITITVNPSPVFTVSPTSQTVCSGVNIANIVTSSTTSGISYTWSRSTNTYLTGLETGTGATIAGAITNSFNTAQSTTFTIVPSVGSCGGNALTATVTVNPKPTIAASPAMQNVCAGSAITNIVITNPNSVSGVSFNWTRNNTLTNQVAGLANSGTTASIGGTATSTATTQQSSTFSIYAIAAGCSSVVAQPVVVLNPLPAAPGNPTVTGSTNCEDVGATFTRAGSPVSPVEWYWQTTALDTSAVNNSTSPLQVYIPGASTTYIKAYNTATGCWSSATGSAASNVKANPLPTLKAFYCLVPGYVQLQSTATLTPTSIAWTPIITTAETSPIYNVDIAGRYFAKYTYSNGCIRTNFIDVADNLVVNGDFTDGNTGFITGYSYRPNAYVAGNGTTGLWPEGTYNVYHNGQYTHSNFWGYDHTTGSGQSPDRFMLVNGVGPATVIWEETVNVVAGIDYYFSAWAMNLNNAGNYARLQFEINGQTLGTIADMSTAPAFSSNPTSAANAQARWIRFYSNPLWTATLTGPIRVRIVNLRPDPNGNDFGLDDISFGTLAPNPVKIITTLATTPVCPDSTIQLTATITGGKAPFIYTWLGPNGFSSSTLTGATITNAKVANGGIYTLQVLDAYNCNPPASKNSNLVTVLNGAPGVWTGAADNDWYWCRNWEDGRVPTQFTDVTVPATAANIAKIDKVTSPYDLNKPAYSNHISIAKEVTFGSSIDSLKTYGNITIANTTGYLNMGTGGVMALYGQNWQNNRGNAGFAAGTDANSRVCFLGTTPQYITTVASDERYYNFLVNNVSSTGLTLNSAAYVANGFYFNYGLINTYSKPPAGSGFFANSLGLLTLGPNSAMPGNVKSDGSGGGIYTMVNGRMAREFTTAGVEFVYPIGKTLPTAKYRPPGAWGITTAGTTTFFAEYFPYPHPVTTIMGGPSLLGIIKPEYWQIDRSGSATGNVKLPYINPGSGNWIGTGNLPAVDPCYNCNVAVVKKESSGIYNFTTLPPNSFDPQYRFYANNGYIYSGPVTSFSPFSIGYSYNVILPVNLVSFEGKKLQNDALLTWNVANSADLLGFELRYSKDGNQFARLASIQPAGLQYSFIHPNIPAGPNYYQLKVFDKNGSSFYSKTVMLTGLQTVTAIKGLQVNPVQNNGVVNVFSASQQKVQIKIYDMDGRLLGIEESKLMPGDNQVQVATQVLAAGMYNLFLTTTDGAKAVLKMIKAQ